MIDHMLDSFRNVVSYVLCYCYSDVSILQQRHMPQIHDLCFQLVLANMPTRIIYSFMYTIILSYTLTFIRCDCGAGGWGDQAKRRVRQLGRR